MRDAAQLRKDPERSPHIPESELRREIAWKGRWRGPRPSGQRSLGAAEEEDDDVLPPRSSSAPGAQAQPHPGATPSNIWLLGSRV